MHIANALAVKLLLEFQGHNTGLQNITARLKDLLQTSWAQNLMFSNSKPVLCPQNWHFHMLFRDAVYVARPDGTARFRWVRAPTTEAVLM